MNAFGWLAGKEALAGGAANVGLYDREYHFDDRESYGLQPSIISILMLTVGGSVRKVLPNLGRDLHLQVRR